MGSGGSAQRLSQCVLCEAFVRVGAGQVHRGDFLLLSIAVSHPHPSHRVQDFLGGKELQGVLLEANIGDVADQGAVLLLLIRLIGSSIHSRVEEGSSFKGFFILSGETGEESGESPSQQN